MQQKLNRRSAVVGLVMAAAVLGASCGGGGSADDPGSTGGPGSGPATGLTGTLWFYGSGDGTLTAPADASAAATFLTSDSEPIPWPDGSQYMEYQLTGGDNDHLVVKETSSGSTVHELDMPNFSGRLRPSPVDKNMVLTQYFESTISETGEFWVIDLNTNTIIHDEADKPKRYKYRWLPDGRYVRFHDETGEIAIASVGGKWQVQGHLPVPANRRLNEVEINPQGTRLALIYRDYDDYDGEDPSLKSDLWVANLDGSGQERVTLDDRTYSVRWSPDGSKLAFDTDTFSCGSVQNCSGGQLLWWAPESARDLNGLFDGATGTAATQFKLKLSDGQVIDLAGKSLRAWLP